jgi:hypothetical protein
MEKSKKNSNPVLYFIICFTILPLTPVTYCTKDFKPYQGQWLPCSNIRPSLCVMAVFVSVVHIYQLHDHCALFLQYHCSYHSLVLKPGRF